MVPRSAEKCRVGPSSAGKGWGRHWVTTRIERVEQPRTACGAEECRVGPSSAGRRRGSVGVPLNDAVVARSAEWEP